MLLHIGQWLGMLLLPSLVSSVVYKCRESVVAQNESLCTIVNFRPTTEAVAFGAVNPLAVIELKFESSQFPRIPRDALQDFHQVETLDIEAVQLTELQPDCLSVCPALKRFIAPFNSLSELGEGVFAGTEHLQWINVSHNAISRLHRKVFRGLSALETLDLSSNLIKFLHKFTFATLPSLRVVLLNRNRLATLDKFILHAPHRLESISLDDNELDQLQLQLRNNHITYIFAAHNGMRHFSLDADSKEFRDHPFFLELRNNRLTSFHVAPEIFAPTFLSLAHNNLTSLSSNSTHLEELYEEGEDANELERGVFEYNEGLDKTGEKRFRSVSSHDINELAVGNLSRLQSIEPDLSLADLLNDLHVLEKHANSINSSNYRRIENSEHHLKVLNLFLIFLLVIVLMLCVFTVSIYVSVKR